MRSLILATLPLLLALPGTGAQGAEGPKMTGDEVLAGAAKRIEQYRKAGVTVRVTDTSGKLLRGAKVTVQQVNHAFLFGCNIFQLFTRDAAGNEAYQRQFAALLNYATLPFYWGSYEHEQGKTKQADLEKMAKWCRDRGMAVKGHPLVWHTVYPKWAPADADATRDSQVARVKDIVSHFAGLVDRWDVVNEATVSHKERNGIGEWIKRDGAAAAVGLALDTARAANPKATLLYNDYNVGPDFEKLLTDLQAAKKPFDAIGIQSHMHGAEWTLERVWEVCETYSRFGKPIHFTETTVLSGDHGWEKPKPWPTTTEGEARQADYVEKLYTVLFSHPSVQAITWWDFADGAWQGAPAGLVRQDLTPKPAYDRLMKLIKQRWWTKADLRANDSGECSTRGFLGRYLVTVEWSDSRKTQEFDLAPGSNVWTAVVPR